MAYKILIVDDDTELTQMLGEYFRLKHYQVETAADGLQALSAVSHSPDLILLDINMPRLDGLAVCQQIRAQVACPILFLTAKVTEQDRVNGLLSGGDDYILKPFSLKELEARVIAHLKREERHNRTERFKFSAGLAVDYAAKTVAVAGRELALTRAEYEIIEFLSQHAGQVFDKERIYEQVNGCDGAGDARGITELVRRIRNKLKTVSPADYIETVWGMGYRWKK